jgi:hypothetical protein
MTRNRCALRLFHHAPSIPKRPVPSSTFMNGKCHRYDAAARILGFLPVRRVHCTHDSHDALQEGMVSLEDDTASGPDKLAGISPAPVAQKTLA